MSTKPIRTRRSFRAWRRGRPFWGGLITLIAGLEIITIVWNPSMPILIRAGAGAAAGYIIGGTLVLCGVLLCIQLGQRVFLSILTILLGLAAFPFTNLGGFLLGTLLAMVGGSLAFGWTPIAREGTPKAETPLDDDTDRPADTDKPDVEAPTVQFPVIQAPTIPLPARHRRIKPASDAPTPENAQVGTRSRQVIGAVLLPLALAVTGSMAVSMEEAVQAAPSGGAIPCQENPQPTPRMPEVVSTTPSPGKPRPVPTPTTAQPTPSPSVEATTPVMPSPVAAPATPVVPSALATPGTRTKPSSTASPLCHRNLTAEPSQPLVAVGHSDLKAAVQEMTGLSYDGIVALPTRDGPIRVLQFSMDKSVSTQFEMSTPGGANHKLNQKSTQLTVSGGVKLYTSRFHARLLGIPVTFTPDLPPPLVLPSMVFKDAEVQLVYLKSDLLQAEKLQLRYS